MIKAIMFDYASVQSLISTSMFQSLEFNWAERFIAAIRECTEVTSLGRQLYCVPYAHGLIVLSAKSASAADNKYLVVKIESTQLLDFNDTDMLSILQGLLRCAFKEWNGSRHGYNVYLFREHNKMAMFPFPVGANSKYRLVIQKSPESRRVQRRFGTGHLFMFRDGHDKGYGPEEKVNATIYVNMFNGVIESYQKIKNMNNEDQLQVDDHLLKITSLDKYPGAAIPPSIGFQNWLPRLTKQQYQFVTKLPSTAERIEGPAGTGKTLCLVLKAVNAVVDSVRKNIEFRGIFFAHNEATAQSTSNLLYKVAPEVSESINNGEVSFLVTTLQAWCGEYLGNKNISENQFLDHDAMAAKELRKLIVMDCLKEVMESSFSTHRHFMSNEFCEFLESESYEVIADILQHEIAVMIKGRANENIDTYKKIPSIRHGLPCRNEGDKSFVYMMYERYRSELQNSGTFDTDDVVLTTLGLLQTPIWRRRRIDEGYDAIYIDETHLFNLNELSVFHMLTRNEGECPLVCAIDYSQAPGDRGLTSDLLMDTIQNGLSENSESTALKSVFRCGPDIVALAYSITASGASMFIGFGDSLEGAVSVYGSDDERKCRKPVFHGYASDEQLIEDVFNRAENLVKDLACSRSDVAIICFDMDILNAIKVLAKKRNKPIRVIETRGDLKLVEQAKAETRFIIGMPDYVGGLEFQAVLLVAIGEGRLPATEKASGDQSKHFLKFRAHNRAYVAITRAKYVCEGMYNSTRGLSKVFAAAQKNQLVDLKDYK